MMRGDWDTLAPGLLAARNVAVEDRMEEVRPIEEAIRCGGDAAVARYTQRFDGFDPGDVLEVPAAALADAWARLDPALQSALRTARDAILGFHEAQRPSELAWTAPSGARLGRRVVPVPVAGAYVPGGRAAYPSTALMTVLAAKAAGVPTTIACTPAGPEGEVPAITLAALHLAGADRVFRIGGAQAVFAMAHGTATVPRASVIVGPGNAYVTAAKTLVAGRCRIDGPAGPSELLVLADATADPDAVTADILAQAEHDPEAWCAVASSDPGLLDAVERNLRSFQPTARTAIVAAALARVALVDADKDALQGIADALAPEHLSIQTEEPERLLQGIRFYGSAFLGPHSRVAFGDYCAGTNHVLPTGGAARIWSGLSVDAFLLRPTHQSVDAAAHAKLRKATALLANAEGLVHHARSVEAGA